MARRARSLQTLLDEVDRRWPSRSKASDGWIGDQAHASRRSDHNPNDAGVVQAQDITGAGGVGQAVWDHLLSTRDRRIKYLIWRGQIVSSTTQPWTPRPYSGSNPHNTHIHISVVDDRARYDDPAPWGLLEEDDVNLTDDQKKWLEDFVKSSVKAEVKPNSLAYIVAAWRKIREAW